MPELSLYGEKFGDLARQCAKEDALFRKGLKEAIDDMDLSSVLIFSTQKAKAIAQQQNLEEKESFQLAYELFIAVFKDSKAPEEKKVVMATKVNQKLQDAFQVVASRKIGVSPEYEARMKAEYGDAFSPAAPVAPTGYTGSASQGYAASSPAQGSGNQDYTKITVKNINLYADQFGKQVQKAIKEDSTFKTAMKQAIEETNLRQVLIFASQKAQALAYELKVPELETFQIAYELFAMVFKDMKVPDERRIMMAVTVNKKLMEAVGVMSSKKTGVSAEAAPQVRQPPMAPARPSFPSPMGAPPGGPSFAPAFQPASPSPTQEYSSPIPGASAPVPSATAKPKVFSSIMAPSSPTTEPQESAPPAAYTPSPAVPSQDDILRQQREALRVQRPGFTPAPAAAPTQRAAPIGFDPFGIMDQWLRGDKRLIQIVDHFEKRSANVMRIVFDPESEGYIPYIDVELMVTVEGGKNIIKGRCMAETGMKYPYNLAIGNNGKKWIAASLDADIPAQESDTIAQLQRVDAKNQLEWDRLMVLLNSDKDLIKSVKGLELRNPGNPSQEIQVPVYVKKDVPSNKVFATSFITPGLKPSQLFIDVMDRIAEDMAQIGASGTMEPTPVPAPKPMAGGFSMPASAPAPAPAPSVNIAARLDQVAKYSEPAPAAPQQFRYGSTESNLSYKTCPYCGRPFPNPNADYRRCPSCLAKLK